MDSIWLPNGAFAICVARENHTTTEQSISDQNIPTHMIHLKEINAKVFDQKESVKIIPMETDPNKKNGLKSQREIIITE
jgi:hypothetical protein